MDGAITSHFDNLNYLKKQTRKNKRERNLAYKKGEANYNANDHKKISKMQKKLLSQTTLEDKIVEDEHFKELCSKQLTENPLDDKLNYQNNVDANPKSSNKMQAAVTNRMLSAYFQDESPLTHFRVQFYKGYPSYHNPEQN